MVAGDEPDLRYGIDRMVVRGRRIFGWGWVCHPLRQIASVTLAVAGAGWQSRLPADFGLVRDDVWQASPSLRDAGASGFVATGYVPAAPVHEWKLDVEFADGGRTAIDITSAADARTGRRRMRELRYVVRAVGRRLARGDLSGIVHRARAQNYRAPALAETTVLRELRSRLADASRVTLVFDHNMGGGANVYRQAIIDERLAGGAAVLLCTYNLPTLDYRLQVLRPGAGTEMFRIASFLPLEEVVAGTAIDEVFVNSPVSFDEPLIFAEWLATLRAAHPRVKLVIAVNDFFPVCPSFVLLNADGRYCGIPALSECAVCLARHRASWVALSPPTTIGPWRAIWRRCLGAADEIRCFSLSTRTLLLRAYPDLDTNRVSIVPHRVDYVPAHLPNFDSTAPLCVGVVGQVSVQKGARIVSDLLARIDREGLDIRVVVIGALDLRVVSKRLRITGRYERKDLADLIEANGVNMLFFPSIWPETFSYVVAETMRLSLPIVSFDLGAPGERLRGYHLGRLCREVSADAALDTLVAFHEELAASRAHPGGNR